MKWILLFTIFLLNVSYAQEYSFINTEIELKGIKGVFVEYYNSGSMKLSANEITKEIMTDLIKAGVEVENDFTKENSRLSIEFYSVIKNSGLIYLITLNFFEYTGINRLSDDLEYRTLTWSKGKFNIISNDYNTRVKEDIAELVNDFIIEFYESNK